MIRFGVSPAFVFSRHTTRFTPDDYCRALERLPALGFAAYQPEVFFAERLDEWSHGGATLVNRTAIGLGLRASQCVAHFLMDSVGSPARLADTRDFDAFARFVEIARSFTGCRVVSMAMAPFAAGDSAPATPAWFAEQRARLAAKLARYLEIATAADFDFAIEIVPFSLVGGSEGFLRLAAELGSPRFGVNLDTGHAWAARENLALLPLKLAGRVFGVHLKDNNSDQNQALAPGRGTVPWPPFLRSLLASGYHGSWDLEIACPASAVDAEYAAGRAFLQALKLD